jgi:hypothetical protein
MKIIGTAEAAKRLNVTVSRVLKMIKAKRVLKMIKAKRLKATKFGNVWMIDPKDLDAVKDRKVGRPRKPFKASRRKIKGSTAS